MVARVHARPRNRLRRRRCHPENGLPRSAKAGPGYRYYAPALGRWLSRDPADESGGLHLYGFVANSPGQLVDSVGLALTAFDIQDEGTLTYTGLWPWQIPSWGFPFYTPGFLDSHSDFEVVAWLDESCCCLLGVEWFEYSAEAYYNLGSWLAPWQSSKIKKHERGHFRHSRTLAIRYKDTLTDLRWCCFTTSDFTCEQRASLLESYLENRFNNDRYYLGDHFHAQLSGAVYSEAAYNATLNEAQTMEVKDWQCSDIDISIGY